MAVYTDISDSALEAFLAEYDLGAPLAFKGIAEGVSNSNWLLETEAGRFILTVYEHRVDERDLPFFLGLLGWLHDHGFPSATPQAGRDGQALRRIGGKPAVIVSFLSGMSVSRPKASHCREAGAGLAWLHQAAQGFPLTRENDLGCGRWRGLFEPLLDAADRLQEGLAAIILQDLDVLERDWPQGLPDGVIHADFFPDNVFFKGGRFAAAIDFYFACHDALAYDLAVAMNAWCFEADGSFNVTSAGQLVAGYESRRPLSAQEREALPVLAWGAALRFFLTRLQDWAKPAESALVRPKDPMEYARKLAVHRAAYASQGLMLTGAAQ
jgi:homoserine kinase type II